MNAYELDISHIIGSDDFVPFDLSNNRATIGDDAGKLTWNASKAAARTGNKTMNTLTIEPAPNGYFISFRMHGLCNLTVDHINSVLGFDGYQHNHPHDGGKVINEWRFLVDGQPCAIWDYKGSHHLGAFSAWGPREVFNQLFTGRVES